MSASSRYVMHIILVQLVSFSYSLPRRKSISTFFTLFAFRRRHKKKKAKVTTRKHHAEAGKWHKTSVTFEDNVATIRIDDVTFTVEDDSLRKKVIKCGVGHIWGTLETKSVIITKK